MISGTSGQRLANPMHQLGLVATPVMLLIALVFATRRQWRSAAELIGLVVLAWLTLPLVYFLVYFCFLHSPRHLRLALNSVQGPARRSALKSAAFNTLITLLLALPFGLYLFYTSSLEQSLLQLVFIGLAALTVPHMLLMARAEFD